MRENKLTLLYKLHTDYFSLCQSVILSVLSHGEIYLNICRNVRGVLTFVIHYIYIYIYIYILWFILMSPMKDSTDNEWGQVCVMLRALSSSLHK